MKIKNLCGALSLVFMFGTTSFAACDPPGHQACQNMKEADQTYRDMKQREEREKMRDKSHDNRLKIDKDTSLGVGRDGVNYKKTY